MRAGAQREQPRAAASTCEVDERYRKIRNDHAVAMYDRAVEDLARVGRDIRAEASI